MTVSKVYVSNTGNQHFDKLVASGNPVGEVVAVDRFIVLVTGLQPCTIHTLVMFEDGSKGFVYQILEGHVAVLHIGDTHPNAGMVAVVQHKELVTKVGKGLIGRVINVTGEPLDNKGPIAIDGVWPVFNNAPKLHERELLSVQLESGITAIDTLLPALRGQRMALLGDSQSGKSTLVAQIAKNQRHTSQIVVYVLIAKRHSDVNMLLSQLVETGDIENSIVVVATALESLVMSYIAPYVGCAIAEYLWQQCDQDTIIIYDDLTYHAQVYREIALLSGSSPGSDFYPGDMLYAHSSLLERAGRLNKNKKHLTSISLVNVVDGDTKAYLPTNIRAITDGQWSLDMGMYRDGVRPAINMSTSITRASGIAHDERQKVLATKARKTMAAYRRAKEYHHFGTELAVETKRLLFAGKQINELVTQPLGEVFSITAQKLMLDTVLNAESPEVLDIALLKSKAKEYKSKITKEEEYEKIRDELESVLVRDSAKVVASTPSQRVARRSNSNKPENAGQAVRAGRVNDAESSKRPEARI